MVQNSKQKMSNRLGVADWGGDPLDTPCTASCVHAKVRTVKFIEDLRFRLQFEVRISTTLTNDQK